jgi:hypothetical protein
LKRLLAAMSWLRGTTTGMLAASAVVKNWPIVEKPRLMA